MLENLDTKALLAYSAFSYIIYLIARSLYRIYFSPISHIPGPKLAALTYFYQSYFDLYPYQGKWLFQQQRLHSQYGPIVRVGPDEVHISDPDFYTEFAGSSVKRRDKSKLWYWFSGSGENIDGSAFATLDHGVHQVRRAAMNPFFSMRKVQELEGRVKLHVEKLRGRFLEVRGTGEVIDVMAAMSALTLDVISEYSFGKSCNTLDEPDMGLWMRKMLEEGVQIHPFARQFRTLTLLMMKFVSFVAPYFAMFNSFMQFEKFMDDLVKPPYEKALKEEANHELNETSILQSMVLSQTLSPAEKSYKRIKAEAFNLVGAGTETTARTLAVGLYHILANPKIHTTLLNELRTLMPTTTSPLPTVASLSKLPYLTATLHETTRIAHGVAGRLVRISPLDDISYSNYKIPRGTTFSMSHYLQHTDPRIFPEPFGFRPERYMGEQGKEVLRYTVPFGKGTRSCLGVNLAWSEMYLAVAALVGGVEGMEVVGTRLEDVTIDREYFIGVFSKESTGVRIRVNG